MSHTSIHSFSIYHEIETVDEYSAPNSVEVNYLTAYSCQFLFHFASNAKLSDLSGILITMIRERDVSFNFPSYLSIERIFYSSWRRILLYKRRL